MERITKTHVGVATVILTIITDCYYGKDERLRRNKYTFMHGRIGQ